ncbi:MAG: tetratricopeptide repeat protein, partial [Bacillota bacterium]|nr:tetratricopeptide repeat protein [Bacillota bacterium]
RERVRYDALALAGLAAGALGQQEKAVRYLEQACALFPQSLLAYQILAELYLNAGEERQAQSVYARMLRAALWTGFEPYDVLITYARRGGQALEFSGRLLEELLPAAEGDRRALAGVEYGLGHIRYLEGRREEARAHFRRAREHLASFLKPDDPSLAKMEELEKACQ